MTKLGWVGVAVVNRGGEGCVLTSASSAPASAQRATVPRLVVSQQGVGGRGTWPLNTEHLAAV